MGAEASRQLKLEEVRTEVVRLSYKHPETVTEDILTVCALYPRLKPYVTTVPGTTVTTVSLEGQVCDSGHVLINLPLTYPETPPSVGVVPGSLPSHVDLPTGLLSQDGSLTPGPGGADLLSIIQVTRMGTKPFYCFFFNQVHWLSWPDSAVYTSMSKVTGLKFPTDPM